MVTAKSFGGGRSPVSWIEVSAQREVAQKEEDVWCREEWDEGKREESSALHLEASSDPPSCSAQAQTSRKQG